jgi:hypothetical protein
MTKAWVESGLSLPPSDFLTYAAVCCAARRHDKHTSGSACSRRRGCCICRPAHSLTPPTTTVQMPPLQGRTTPLCDNEPPPDPLVPATGDHHRPGPCHGGPPCGLQFVHAGKRRSVAAASATQASLGCALRRPRGKGGEEERARVRRR